MEQVAMEIAKSADVSAPASKKTELPLEEWLDALGKSPAYEGIDIRQQWARMEAWCSTNGKQPTRRRFVNWLNRCDRSERLNGHRNGHQERPSQEKINGMLNERKEMLRTLHSWNPATRPQQESAIKDIENKLNLLGVSYE